jgi:hypothetical protein
MIVYYIEYIAYQICSNTPNSLWYLPQQPSGNTPLMPLADEQIKQHHQVNKCSLNQLRIRQTQMQHNHSCIHLNVIDFQAYRLHVLKAPVVRVGESESWVSNP